MCWFLKIVVQLVTGFFLTLHDSEYDRSTRETARGVCGQRTQGDMCVKAR